MDPYALTSRSRFCSRTTSCASSRELLRHQIDEIVERHDAFESAFPIVHNHERVHVEVADASRRFGDGVVLGTALGNDFSQLRCHSYVASTGGCMRTDGRNRRYPGTEDDLAL